MKKGGSINATVIKSHGSVLKAEIGTAVNSEFDDGSGFITPAVDLNGLKTLVNNSSILPQCIRAYKNNIAGFGIGVRYITDEDETPEMKAEWDKITEVLEYLNMDQDTKEVFEDVIEARETYGIAYLEVIRNIAGEVVGVEFIRDTPSVSKTAPLVPYVDIEFDINGQTQSRKKKFCKYRQTLNGKTVYFKEMGDPRVMDLRNGEYAVGKNSVPIEYQANELLEFAIGTSTYGEVRWIGTALNVDGSRKAESLNNRYFVEGRHTPLMFLVKGGTLTDTSFNNLQTYMDDIKGENGQHGFLIVEAENTDNRTDMEGESKPEVEIVKLADVLQKDELFQDYLNNNRRKVQSSFQLPDLYVGYTTDFNRATAQSAQEVTEKQVFQPERQSLAWIINHKLLADYHFKYVEAVFLTPDITNPDDMAKILNITERAGGLTPNKAKELTAKIFNEPAENYEGDWGDTPLAYSKAQQPGGVGGFDNGNSQQVQKSAEHDNVELVAVMKEIRKLLLNSTDLCQNSVIKSEGDGWATINGTKVHFDENGSIDMGPSSLKEWASSNADSTIQYQGEINEFVDRETYTEKKEVFSKNAGYNLSDEEVAKLVDSVTEYTTDQYIGILAAQNGFSGSFANYSTRMDETARAQAMESAKNLEKAIKLSDKYTGEVKRALGFDFGGMSDGTEAFKVLNASLVEGNTIKMRGMSSWTTSDIAIKEMLEYRTFLTRDISGYAEVVLSCRSKTGVDIANMSAAKSQQEVLFSKNASFKVTSVERKTSYDASNKVDVTRIDVRLEELD